MLNHQQTLQFLQLRKNKLIGRIWPTREGYLIAPKGTIEGMNDYSQAEFILTEKLVQLIENLSLRKGPQEEKGERQTMVSNL